MLAIWTSAIGYKTSLPFLTAHLLYQLHQRRDQFSFQAQTDREKRSRIANPALDRISQLDCRVLHPSTNNLGSLQSKDMGAQEWLLSDDIHPTRKTILSSPLDQTVCVVSITESRCITPLNRLIFSTIPFDLNNRRQLQQKYRAFVVRSGA